MSEWKPIYTNFVPSGSHFDEKKELKYDWYARKTQKYSFDNPHAPKKITIGDYIFSEKDYSGQLPNIATFAIESGLKPLKFRKILFSIEVEAEDARGEKKLYEIRDFGEVRPL